MNENLFGFRKLDDEEKKAMLIFGIVFIIFYLLRIFTYVYYFPDSVEYKQTADAIGSGAYFAKQPNIESCVFITKRPFVYPLFLLLLNKLSLKAILFIQTLFGVFNIYLILQLNKRINGHFKKSIYVLLLFTPSVFIYAQILMTEWLVMTMLMLSALILTAPLNGKRFWVLEIITVLLAFTKPVFYPFVFVNFLFFGIYCMIKRKFSPALFLPLLCVIGYMKFNEYRTGDFHFSSIQNTNFIDYNLYFFESRQEGNDSADAWKHAVHARALQAKTFREFNDCYRQAEDTVIGKHFTAYSFYHFYTALRGTIDPGRFDLMTFAHEEHGDEGFLYMLNRHNGWQSVFQSKYAWLYILLIPCFLLQIIKMIMSATAAVINRRKISAGSLYLLLLVLYYIFVTGPVNASRYMMPLQGILIVFAINGIRYFKSRNIDKTYSC